MPVRNLFEGRAALIDIDIQAATFTDNREGDADRSIPLMPGYAARMRRARAASIFDPSRPPLGRGANGKVGFRTCSVMC